MGRCTLERHALACTGFLERHEHLFRRLLLVIAALCAGCAGVKVRTVTENSNLGLP